MAWSYTAHTILVPRTILGCAQVVHTNHYYFKRRPKRVFTADSCHRAKSIANSLAKSSFATDTSRARLAARQNPPGRERMGR
eukprot:4135457-Prymnesium_polylepis.1